MRSEVLRKVPDEESSIMTSVSSSKPVEPARETDMINSLPVNMSCVP